MSGPSGVFNKIRHEIRYWLLRRLPTCQDLVPVLSESLERPLGARERLVVHAHLLTCVWCVWYLDQLRTLRDLAHRRAANSDDAQRSMLADAARERIRRRLSDARN